MVSTTMPMVGLRLAHLAGGVETAAVGQPDVEDDDVGGVLGDDRASASATDPGLADDGEVSRALERASQSLADQLVVVDEDDGDGHGGHPTRRVVGPPSVTSTVVPPVVPVLDGRAARRCARPARA